MRNIFKSIMQPTKDEEGASAVEYAIMVALIAAVIILSVGILGENTRNAFNTLNFDWANPEKICPDGEVSIDGNCGIGND